MGSKLGDIHGWIEDFARGKRIKNFEVVCPATTISTGDNISKRDISAFWGGDPVHLTPVGYDKLEEQLCESGEQLMDVPTVLFRREGAVHHRGRQGPARRAEDHPEGRDQEAQEPAGPQEEGRRGRHLRRGDRRRPSGFAKPTLVSKDLCDFLSMPEGSELARTEVTRLLNKYIKDNNLQDPVDRRTIRPDLKLQALLNIKGDTQLKYFNMQSYIKHHFVKAEAPAPAPAEAPAVYVATA